MYFVGDKIHFEIMPSNKPLTSSKPGACSWGRGPHCSSRIASCHTRGARERSPSLRGAGSGMKSSALKCRILLQLIFLPPIPIRSILINYVHNTLDDCSFCSWRFWIFVVSRVQKKGSWLQFPPPCVNHGGNTGFLPANWQMELYWITCLQIVLGSHQKRWCLVWRAQQFFDLWPIPLTPPQVRPVFESVVGDLRGGVLFFFDFFSLTDASPHKKSIIFCVPNTLIFFPVPHIHDSQVMCKLFWNPDLSIFFGFPESPKNQQKYYFMYIIFFHYDIIYKWKKCTWPTDLQTWIWIEEKFKGWKKLTALV